MNFYIQTDLTGERPIAFPERLSQFFEQYAGFGLESEVAQTAHILDIDLSVFQRYNKVPAKEVAWIEMRELINATRALADRIQRTPEFYRAIHYGGVPAMEFRKDFLQATAQKNDKKLAELVKRWQNTPDSAFPPDTGYLSSGGLQKELAELEKALVFLEKLGAKKVNLVCK